MDNSEFTSSIYFNYVYYLYFIFSFLFSYIFLSLWQHLTIPNVLLFWFTFWLVPPVAILTISPFYLCFSFKILTSYGHVFNLDDDRTDISLFETRPVCFYILC